jgi:hypothetical protein
MKLKPIKYISIPILKKDIILIFFTKKFEPYFLLVILVDFEFLKSTSKIN